MIYLPLSKLVDSSEVNVAAGASVTAEGQALVRAAGAPASGVTVSTGTGTAEIFAGFAIAGQSAAPFPEPYASKVENFTVPVSGAITLAFTPVSGQIMVYDNTAGAVVAITGGVTLTGKTIAGLTAGNSVTVTYLFAQTVVQRLARQGDIQPGGYVGNYVGQVGCAKRGLIYTDQFDASKNWAVATGLKLAANGQVTDQSGSGTVLVGAYVVAAPNSDVPFLGFEFSAA